MGETVHLAVECKKVEEVMPKDKQTFMEKMAAFIVHKRKTILLIYLVAFVFLVKLMMHVRS